MEYSKVINTFFFWCMLVISVIGFYILKKDKFEIKTLEILADKNIKKRQKIYMFVIFIITIFIAVFIRTYSLGSFPVGVNQDEAMAAIDAKALAFYGTDRFGMRYPIHFTAWGYGQMSVMLSYLMIPFIKIFGFSLAVIRLPAAIISVFGMVAAYLWSIELGEELFIGKDKKSQKNRFGILVLILIAINPWHIMQSRWALDCNMLPHFFILGIYFLSKGIKKIKFTYISMIFFAACMYCYGLAFLSIPLFLVISCIYLLSKKQIKWFQALICLGIFIILSLPIDLVMLINTFQLKTIETKFFIIPYFPNSIRSNDILFFADGKINQFLENIKSVFELVLLQKKDAAWNSIADFGTIYLCSLPFSTFGAIILFKKARGNHKIQILKIYILSSLITGVLIRGINVNKMNIIYYGMILLTAIGIYYSLLLLKNKKVKIWVATVYLFLFGMFMRTYFTKHQNEIQYHFNAGFQQSLDYADLFKPDIYYISSEVWYGGTNNPKTAEILTLFNQDIDIPYYQGKTNTEHNIDRLPYDERYQYIEFDPNKIDDSENAVYILPEKYWDFFDEVKYNKSRFVNYFTAVKW